MRYKCLNIQEFKIGNRKIVPIRIQDRYDILKWRNDQIYHLRQSELLTKEKQDCYFNNIVSKLFEQEKPNQILFSYIENEVCIGYGGLVHINWIDKNAEISFIINTELEKDFFQEHWQSFIHLIEKVAFVNLKLHKLSTYAYDLRPKLYYILDSLGYKKEAVLKEHCLYENKFIDVIIHSKFYS